MHIAYYFFLIRCSLQLAITQLVVLRKLFFFPGLYDDNYYCLFETQINTHTHTSEQRATDFTQKEQLITGTSSIVQFFMKISENHHKLNLFQPKVVDRLFCHALKIYVSSICISMFQFMSILLFLWWARVHSNKFTHVYMCMVLFNQQ